VGAFGLPQDIKVVIKLRPMIPSHEQNGRVVGHPDQCVYPDVAFLDRRFVGRQIAVYDEEVRMRLNCVPHKPLQTPSGVGEVVIFF
jgi:hypothetical protein